MSARTRVSAVLVAACLACVGLLAAAPAAPAAFGDRVLREGMSGADVKALQRKLTRLGLDTAVDGYFGRQTKRSMKRWERRNDRKVNGRCSRKEARKIKRQVRRKRRAEAETDPADGSDSGTGYGPRYDYASRRMRFGDRGTDVARLQRFLTGIGLKTPVDGSFGRETRRNMKDWEAWQYLRADGIANPKQAKRIRRQARRGRRYEARHHVFPVRGPHDYGGAGARFGAPRSGHTHQGHDVGAAHGTPLVAVHHGKVAYRQYQAGGAGHYLVIHGRDGSDSVYMHMSRTPIVAPGRKVRAGERIGRVGSTGSSTGPHLHFELWTPHWFDGGSPYDPLPKLKRWDRLTP